jgi:uncharacterized protein (DUF924 family)
MTGPRIGSSGVSQNAVPRHGTSSDVAPASRLFHNRPVRLPPFLAAQRERLILGEGSDPTRPPQTPTDVLRFWFGRLPGPRFELRDAMWLPTRIPCWGGHWASEWLDVDAIIRDHFGELHQRACDGELGHWTEDAEGRLALVILLDQLSRNIYRDTPRAFAQDAATLPIVEEALALGQDKLFNPLARTYLYLPLMHHEDLELLDRCIALYEQAYAESRGLARVVLTVEMKSGKRHREIVQRFGRYPHRNAILGRESTAEELAFLEEHFSSF